MTDMLNLALGAGNASGTPMQAELIGAGNVTDSVANSESPMAFSEALLNVVNTLMVGQVKGANGNSVTSLAIRQNTDESHDDAVPDDTSLLKVDAQQQLLDALLMPRTLPVSIEQVKTGEALPAMLLQPSLPTMTRGQMPSVSSTTLMPQPAISLENTVAAKMELPPTQAMSVQQVAPQLMTAMAAATPEVAAQPPAGGEATNVVSRESRLAPSTTLKLDTEDSRWSQQLQRVLGERLQVQVKNQIQHATIRLDPPDMGKIDISLHIENGRMQVQINASHADVYRALQQTSNDLRQSLTEQNVVQVNVQVSSQSGGQQQSKDAPFSQQQAAIQSASEIAPGETRADKTRREDDSVLLTV